MSDGLEPLSEEARAVLASTEGMDDPDPRAKARIKRRVMAAVAAGAASAASAGGTAAASAAASTATAGAAVGIASSGAVLTKAALAITLVVGSVGVVASEPWEDAPVEVASAEPAPETDDAPSAVTATPTQAAPVEAAVVPETEEPDGEPEPEAATEVEAEPSPPVEPARPDRARAASEREPTASPQPPEPALAADALRDELTLLTRARQGLASGDHEGALRALTSHRARYPSGTLAAERDGTEALVLCAHPGHDGRPAARAFLAQHPRSPLAERVRGCL